MRKSSWKYIVYSVLGLVFIMLGGYFALTGNVPTKENIASTIGVWKAQLIENKEKETEKDINARHQVTPITVTEVLEEQTATSRYDVVYLYLDSSTKFPVRVPEGTDIITDYDKFIYAEDNSFSVMVVSGVEKVSLSQDTGVRDAIVLSTDTVRSKAGTVGPLEAARLIVNDKAIIIRSYTNSAFFTTALEGLQECDYENVRPMQMKNVSSRAKVDKIPSAKEHEYVITYNAESDMSDSYLLPDGTLTVSKEFKKFEDACLYLWEHVSTSAGTNKPDKVYVTDTEFYVEAENITAYMYAVNFNTTLRLFGVGDAARNNIRAYAQH